MLSQSRMGGQPCSAASVAVSATASVAYPFGSSCGGKPLHAGQGLVQGWQKVRGNLAQEKNLIFSSPQKRSTKRNLVIKNLSLII